MEPTAAIESITSILESLPGSVYNSSPEVSESHVGQSNGGSTRSAQACDDWRPSEPVSDEWRPSEPIYEHRRSFQPVYDDGITYEPVYMILSSYEPDHDSEPTSELEPPDEPEYNQDDQQHDSQHRTYTGPIFGLYDRIVALERYLRKDTLRVTSPRHSDTDLVERTKRTMTSDIVGIEPSDQRNSIHDYAKECVATHRTMSLPHGNSTTTPSEVDAEQGFSSDLLEGERNMNEPHLEEPMPPIEHTNTDRKSSYVKRPPKAHSRRTFSFISLYSGERQNVNGPVIPSRQSTQWSTSEEPIADSGPEEEVKLPSIVSRRTVTTAPLLQGSEEPIEQFTPETPFSELVVEEPEKEIQVSRSTARQPSSKPIRVGDEPHLEFKPQIRRTTRTNTFSNRRQSVRSPSPISEEPIAQPTTISPTLDAVDTVLRRYSAEKPPSPISGELAVRPATASQLRSLVTWC
jgi:hypothetical protein